MVDAGGDDLFASVATAISTVLGRKLTPEEYEDLKRSLSDPAVLDTLLSRKRTYLIIGSYGTAEREGDERERLELVRDTVERRHPNHRAVLLDDLPAFHPNWVVQFAVVAHRVDHVVGVFEHGFGGHEFEAGVLTLLRPHDLWILKRTYPTEAAEREHFDGMLAHFFDVVAERDALRTWRTESDLRDLATTAIPGEDTEA